MKTIIHFCSMLTLFAIMSFISANAQTAAPPIFGEDTKGEPALPEVSTPEVKKSKHTTKATDKKDSGLSNSLLGEATIKESRRESGQVYRIELEHSSGSKQYIEENDSDGKIESNGIDLEDTPNLPKWKIGSW